jgi:site-specific DNA-methyltransferase (adenine-specific)
MYKLKIEIMIEIKNVDCLEGIKELADGSVDVVITDPPYSTPVITSFGRKKFKNLADLSVQEFYFKAIKKELERVLKPDGRVFFFCDDKFYPILYSVFYEWLNLGLIVWDKGKIGMGRPIRKQHELIFYANQGSAEFQKFGEITHIPSVLKVKHDTNKIHGAQKPVELIEHLINGFSKEGDLIIDLFGGSGSTGKACQNLNRNFVGFELNTEIANASSERLSL